MTPEETVRALCTNVSRRDPAQISHLLDENVVFMNVGLDITYGREAVLTRFSKPGGYWALFPDVFDFRIRNLGSSGNHVYTERVDVMGTNGIEAPLPVLGIFEVVNGKITQWRDYCDITMVRRLLAGETVPTEEGFPPGTCDVE